MRGMERLRVGFVISDTGGGHRAAAQAVAAALDFQYRHRFQHLFIDVFRLYAPPPWRWSPAIYPLWVRYSRATYSGFFLMSNWLLRAPAPGARAAFAARAGKRILSQLVAEQQPDVLVLVHAIPVRPLAAARQALGLQVPMIALVADFWGPHVAWFHPALDLVLATSQAVEKLAQSSGVAPTRIKTIGPLVHPKFARIGVSREEARRLLGWDKGKPTVLLLGGGEGMGRLAPIARAIDRRVPEVQLAIVCGRNERLYQSLSRLPWRSQVHLYGFADNLEVLMQGADVLVTKAGPLTIAEAAASGLPMILYEAIPFQETENAKRVVQSGAGAFLKSPAKIAATLVQWFEDEKIISRYGRAAKAMAAPDSAFAAASAIAGLCGLPRTTS